MNKGILEKEDNIKIKILNKDDEKQKCENVHNVMIVRTERSQCMLFPNHFVQHKTLPSKHNISWLAGICFSVPVHWLPSTHIFC